MAEKRKVTRIRSKLDDLPPEIKLQVDAMLADVRNTYADIAAYLQDAGYDISKSAVGRYALRSNNATQRLLEAQAQTKALVEAIKANPEADYTEAALQIMGGELTQKLAAAQEEWDRLPVEDAAKLMVALSRTKAYKDKIKADLQARTRLALEEFKRQTYAELEGHEPELCERLIAVANRVAERLEADDAAQG